MTEEIPIWVNGIIQWVSGVDRKTTCRDVIEAVLLGEGSEKRNVKDYTIMERWRRVERPLDENSKILKIWSHWGDEKKEVRLCLKRINNDIDSGRGSPVGAGGTPSLKRRRHHRCRGNGKPPWSHQETLHPKRLAELGELDREEYEEYQSRRQLEGLEEKSDGGYDHLIYDSRHCTYGRKSEETSRKKSGHRSYQCAGTGVLHSTLIPGAEDECCKPSTSKCCSKRQSKSKVRNSENIEKLMKLILAQGATIQSQLQKLKEREEQIESLEHERHRERVEKNGRNYLLETYLGSLNEAEIPEEAEKTEKPEAEVAAREEKTAVPQRGKRSKSESRPEGKENGNGLKRALSDNAIPESCETWEEAKEESKDLVELRRIQSQVEMWEKVFKINKKLEREEENLVRLHIKIKRFQAENTKFVKDEEEEEGSQEVDRDREVVQKDLETLREDLDQNSKEIYQNFTKLKENDQVVEKKRGILQRLMTDLEETEHEHSMLSEMVRDANEGRTSFSEEAINQRVENIAKPEESDSKPKIVKISFDDQIRTEKLKEHASGTPGTIKGILKNRNANDLDWKDRIEEGKYPCPAENPFRYHDTYFRQGPGGAKHAYFNKTGGNDQSVYGNQGILNSKTNIHNDTDSSTSSDTSGMCSMYSSSPTAEEPYVEPGYVLDTLV
ncbi:UNVERIFIED_CONTAM: hypothetical protein PYX00_006030 [Menopon gallinae]|uniref:Ras-associating domain-containing protein n=1 Tax=Menopon gallinae TaxID=328185 RepID=A0AAW2HUZ9_9NEOP